MSRWIDADALIKHLDDAIQDAKRKDEICDYWEDDRSNLLYYLDSAPTIDALSEWVPCSERLPSEDGYYLCCNKRYLPYVGHFLNGQWNDFDGTIVHADAWMPLPKPYGEREGE